MTFDLLVGRKSRSECSHVSSSLTAQAVAFLTAGWWHSRKPCTDVPLLWLFSITFRPCEWEQGREPLPRLWLVDSAWSRGSCLQSAEPGRAHYPLQWGKRPTHIGAVRFSQKCHSNGEVRNVPIHWYSRPKLLIIFECVRHCLGNKLHKLLYGIL